MNVKTTIELPEPLLRAAERLVTEGRYPSVDSVVSAGIEKMLYADDEAGQMDDGLLGMADEIRRRANLPADEWVEWNAEALSSRLKARLDEKYR
ncbi:hypothetical protein [Rhizobium sp. SGZ-381]|uniref:hypothetical protein n=1 Tax=Rhizobium sp. SGZ-381 TaxID=3342800 RepID=UPI0036729B96